MLNPLNCVHYRLSVTSFLFMICLIFLIILSMKYEANCLPLNEIIQISNLNSQNNEGCISGSELRNLCEKCAKITKSFVAYPLCCRNSEGVRDWCQLYLDFTLNRK
jgi:hypothetical protein